MDAPQTDAFESMSVFGVRTDVVMDVIKSDVCSGILCVVMAFGIVLHLGFKSILLMGS